MNGVKAIGCIILFIIGLFLSSLFSPFSTKVAEGQIACPVGFQRNILGTCEPVTNRQTCPVGFQRSTSGICVPVTNLQTCPVGFQTIPPGICVPIAGTGSNLYPYGTSPQTAFNQPQQTFTQPSSSNVPTASPTLTKQSAGQLSEWFPSLPAIACGGTSTMTTIGSVERDNGGDNGGDGGDKDYALQIKSDGGPSADPESVDGRVFAGEKNIERNNGKDFDIKNVFNDCQVSMFDD
jgi:hypothetical protein